jgi:hypothetical protein
VLRFRVEKSFNNRYEVHKVGGPKHVEYWIPPEDLGEFNRDTIGPIEPVSEFR